MSQVQKVTTTFSKQTFKFKKTGNKEVDDAYLNGFREGFREGQKLVLKKLSEGEEEFDDTVKTADGEPVPDKSGFTLIGEQKRPDGGLNKVWFNPTGYMLFEMPDGSSVTKTLKKDIPFDQQYKADKGVMNSKVVQEFEELRKDRDRAMYLLKAMQAAEPPSVKNLKVWMGNPKVGNKKTK